MTSWIIRLILIGAFWYFGSIAYQITTKKRATGGEFGEAAREGCVGYDKDGRLVVKDCDEAFKDD